VLDDQSNLDAVTRDEKYCINLSPSLDDRGAFTLHQQPGDELRPFVAAITDLT